MNTYEFNGVSTYAQVWRFEVQAKSKKQAKEIFKKEYINENAHRDEMMAEYQDCIIDEPIKLED